jgi:hypothetical protein
MCARRTFIEQFIAQDRIRAHLRVDTNYSTEQFLLCWVLFVGLIETPIDSLELGVHLLEPATSGKI